MCTAGLYSIGRARAQGPVTWPGPPRSHSSISPGKACGHRSLREGGSGKAKNLLSKWFELSPTCVLFSVQPSSVSSSPIHHPPAPPSQGLLWRPPPRAGGWSPFPHPACHLPTRWETQPPLTTAQKGGICGQKSCCVMGARDGTGAGAAADPSRRCGVKRPQHRLATLSELFPTDLKPTQITPAFKDLEKSAGR
nr:uncharacterized protein LOC129529571 [Gorilla gorilla gorilla]